MVVLSTHLSASNPFNRLLDDVRAGRKDYHLLRITFADALADGYYEMVCKRLGRAVTKQGKQDYVRDIRRKQLNPEQELDCIPGGTEGGYLPRRLLEENLAQDAVVARFAMQDHTIPAGVRMQQAKEWCERVLRGCEFSGYSRFGVGIDVGRHHDLTVLWVFGVDQQLRRKTVLVAELQQVAHDQQRRIAEEIITVLPAERMVGIDRTGIGDSLAEALQERFTGSAIGVSLGNAWYAEHWPRFKAALENATLILPGDAMLIDDLEQVMLLDGVPKIPKKTSQTGRHADGAVAALLGFWAAAETTRPVDFYTPEGVQRTEDGELSW